MPGGISIRKWKIVKRNAFVGVVFLIQYSSKLSPETYRLGRIINTDLVTDGLFEDGVWYVLCNGDSS